MITRVYIDNFRCFSNFEFKPSRINLLLGANGTGKSSLIEFLTKVQRLLLSGDDVESLFGVMDRTRWDSRSLQTFEMDIALDGEQYTYSLTLDQDPNRDRVALAGEQVVCGDRTLFRYERGTVHLHKNDGREGASFSLRPERSFLSQVEERPETKDLLRFLGFLRTVRMHKIDPTRIASTSQEEQQYLRVDASNFASWYRHVSQEYVDVLPEYFAAVQKVLPGFRALKLLGAGKQGRTRDLIAQMKSQDGQNYDIDFEALSDGQRVLLVLYSLLMDGSMTAGTLVLDEPENYVSLSEIQPWLAELDEALADQGQLFLISHHPEVIDFLAAETPFVFERPDDGPVRVRLAPFDRAQGVKASEQVARGLVDAD